MQTNKKTLLLLAVLGSLVVVGAVLAAPTVTTIERYVLGGGGGPQEGGIYSLDGTLGQAIVGTDSILSYELCSGFWCGEPPLRFNYLPLGQKPAP